MPTSREDRMVAAYRAEKRRQRPVRYDDYGSKKQGALGDVWLALARRFNMRCQEVRGIVIEELQRRNEKKDTARRRARQDRGW